MLIALQSSMDVTHRSIAYWYLTYCKNTALQSSMDVTHRLIANLTYFQSVFRWIHLPRLCCHDLHESRPSRAIPLLLSSSSHPLFLSIPLSFAFPLAFALPFLPPLVFRSSSLAPSAARPRA